MKVRAELSVMLWRRFVLWLLIDPEWGAMQFANGEEQKKVIQDVADAYQAELDGKPATGHGVWEILYQQAYDIPVNLAVKWDFDNPDPSACAVFAESMATCAASSAARVGSCITSQVDLSDSVIASWAYNAAEYVSSAAAYANGDKGIVNDAQPTRNAFRRAQIGKLLELAFQG